MAQRWRDLSTETGKTYFFATIVSRLLSSEYIKDHTFELRRKKRRHDWSSQSYTTRPAPKWLDSSVCRALHRYRRGHGFESLSGLKFFQALILQLLKLCITAMINHVFICLSVRNGTSRFYEKLSGRKKKLSWSANTSTSDWLIRHQIIP